MKLYEAELMAFEFAKGWHTLKEWANAGINSVRFNNHSYWDGLMDGEHPITDAYNPMLELDYWSLDEDGYHIAILKEVEEYKL